MSEDKYEPPSINKKPKHGILQSIFDRVNKEHKSYGHKDRRTPTGYSRMHHRHSRT